MKVGISRFSSELVTFKARSIMKILASLKSD